MMRFDGHTHHAVTVLYAVPNNRCLCHTLFFFFFFWGDVAFSKYSVSLPFPLLYYHLYGEYLVRFPSPVDVFLPCDHTGWIFDIISFINVRIRSINQINNKLTSKINKNNRKEKLTRYDIHTQGNCNNGTKYSEKEATSPKKQK